MSEPMKKNHIPVAAILSAAQFAREFADNHRHAEAVADCAHCNLSFLATWAEILAKEVEGNA